MSVGSRGLGLSVAPALFTVGAVIPDSVSPLRPGADHPHSPPRFSIMYLGGWEVPGKDRCWDAGHLASLPRCQKITGAKGQGHVPGMAADRGAQQLGEQMLTLTWVSVPALPLPSCVSLSTLCLGFLPWHAGKTLPDT